MRTNGRGRFLGAHGPRPAVLGALLVPAFLAAAPAYAMHISDGVLPRSQSLFWFALCIPFMMLAIRDFNRRKARDLNYVPLVAMVGASVFILSVMHFPIAPAGSSSHPTGGALAAVLIGPMPAMLVSCIALLLQALFLGHGGITSWGANTFSMGIMGVLVGYGVYKAPGVSRLPLFWRAGIAALVSDLLGTYGTAALQLALAAHGDRTIAGMWLFNMAAYLPAQGPLAIMDFVVAGYMCRFVAQRRPDIAGHVGLISRELPLPKVAANLAQEG